MTDTQEPKKGANRLKKEAIIEEIKLKLDGSKSIVLTDYQGLTHLQIEGLKKQLKEVDATFAITKNTLLKISLSSSKNYADMLPDEALNAPTATLFMSGDVVEPLKRLAKLAKEAGLPKIKIGIIDGQVLDEAQVIKLSSLPGRDTLLAQLVGTLNSPIQGLVVVLNGNIVKLAMTLQAISNLKSQIPNQPIAEPAAETATTEASDSAIASDATPAPAPAPTEEAAPAETTEKPETQAPIEEPVAEAPVAEEPTPSEATEDTPAENNDNSSIDGPSSAPTGATEGQEGGENS